MAEGKAQVVGVSSGTRDPLLEYVEKSPRVSIMPLLQLDATATRFLTASNGPAQVATVLSNFFGRPSQDDAVTGYCLDASPLVPLTIETFSTLGRQVATALSAQGLTSCVKLPSSTPNSLLVVANRFFDTVIVNGYQEYWIGSAPQPLADKSWFEAHVTSLQEHVAPEKLVIELGTHAVDWVSGQPRPEIQSFAQIMSALAEEGENAEFAPQAGNTRASYIDAKGMQHRVWMFDAASTQNQILTLQNKGIAAIGLSGLGYEDPGIWAVLDQTTRDAALSGESLKNIVLSDYVELFG